jgi:hypothetical protein
MAFMIDEAFLPATLTAPPMTDQQFAEFCSEHPDLFFEQLGNRTDQNGTGIATDSSAAFVLPNGALRSSGASEAPKPLG